MNSRIGRKLLLAIIICIVLTVGIVSTITIWRSSSHTNELMAMQASTGMKSMLGGMETQAGRLSDIIDVMTTTLMLDESADLDSVWNARKSTDGDFAALFGPGGEVFWKSTTYDLADFNVANIDNDGYKGLVLDSKGGLTLQAVEPFIRDGHFNGGIVVGMHMTENSWLDRLKEENECEFTVFNGTIRYATTVIDGGSRAVGTSMADNVKATVIDGKQSYTGTADILGQKHYVNYMPVVDINNKVIGAFFAGQSSAEADELMNSMIITTIIVAVVVAGLGLVVIGFFAIKMIVSPIKEAEKLAAGMSRGKLSGNITQGFVFAADEVGDFVRNLQATEDNLFAYINDIKGVLEQMASGDFTAQPQVTYVGDFSGIKVSFDQISEALREIIGEISDTSRNVSGGANQIADASQMLAEGTTRQAASIEQLSATANEITNKVQENAKNAAEAGKISSESAEKIEFQNGEVQNMLSAMDEIKEKSDQIQNIIKAIDDIAFQTNILSLNAAIEAARAGEAGKGFAVVADEVRTLAAKSAESAKQTGDLINATIDAVNKGTLIAQRTADTMKEVIELSNRTNEYISGISVASELQADSIRQIKTGIDQISTVVQQNSATAEETAASCVDLNNDAQVLLDQISKLKV